jgi:DNA-binding NarL/FixJ family response regulator
MLQVVPISREYIFFIDDRTFIRECVVRCLESCYDGAASVASFATTNDCVSTALDNANIAFVLYAIHHRRASDREIEQNLSQLMRAFPSTPVILLSDGEDADRILDALRRGARGYIPTSATLDVAVGATHVVWAGGTFVPASSISELTHTGEDAECEPVAAEFTPRQMAVLARLRQGKSNRIIARELNISESTVKAHVRNLMQTLKASNRTQIVFRTRDLFPSDSATDDGHEQEHLA